MRHGWESLFWTDSLKRLHWHEFAITLCQWIKNIIWGEPGSTMVSFEVVKFSYVCVYVFHQYCYDMLFLYIEFNRAMKWNSHRWFSVVSFLADQLHITYSLTYSMSSRCATRMPPRLLIFIYIHTYIHTYIYIYRLIVITRQGRVGTYDGV